MYLPLQFAEPQVEEVHRLIRENPLGALVRYNGAGFEAEHLPFLLDTLPGAHSDASGTLIAHVARANPVWQETREGDQVLVMFRGAQGYISPNWYPGKHDTHRRVPTWNYEVVHAHGTIHFRDDEKYLRGIVARLTRQHEVDQPIPWKMSDAPADFLSHELSHIVGLEVRILRLDCKRKLNQHHERRDREGAICALEARGNRRLADAMRATAGPAQE